MDSTKMNLVSDLVQQRPGLRTVILNMEILSYPCEFIEPWFYKLNAVSLKFLHAVDVSDINDAFRNLDENGDGKISMYELGKLCGPRIAQYWGYKYGDSYEVPIMKDDPKKEFVFDSTQHIHF